LIDLVPRHKHVGWNAGVDLLSVKLHPRQRRPSMLTPKPLFFQKRAPDTVWKKKAGWGPEMVWAQSKKKKFCRVFIG